MSIELIVAEHYLIAISIADDCSFKSRLRVWSTGEVIDLASAFDNHWKASTGPRREGLRQFFRGFASVAVLSLRFNLLRQFLLFDHSNDDGPTFDDKYLDSIRKIQIELIDEIRQSLQRQTDEPVGNAEIEKLLEDHGLPPRLYSISAESILAQSIDEFEAINLKNSFVDGGDSYFGTFDDYELKLAQYKTRREGLTIRDNQQLVARTHEEILVRTSAIGKPVAATSEEPEVPEHSESQDIDGDHKAHTFTHRQKGPRLDSRRIWKHLTISRDETSASNFLQERLLILFFNKPDTCTKQGNLEENNINDTEASDPAKQEQQSVSLATHSRIGAMAEQESVTNSPDTYSYSPRPFINMDSRHNGYSTDDEEKHGDMRPHPIGSVTSIGLGSKATEDASRSMHENWKMIHFISETTGRQPLKAYIDKPVWGPGLKGDEFSLKAFLPVSDAEGYVRQAGFDFSINREYSNQCLQPELRRALSKKEPPSDPLHHREYIKLHSQQMIDALEAFLTLQPGFWDTFPFFDARQPIEAPYMFWYIYRSPDALQQLSPSYQSLMGTLTSWIDRNYEEKYTEAKRQLDRGVITLRTMPFLLFPGDVIVWKEKEKKKAAITSSLLIQESPPILYWDSTRPWTEGGRLSDSAKKGEFSSIWKVQTWSYKFDGEFLRDKGSKTIKFKASSVDQEVPISKLGVHPLRFADEKTKIQLETRGKNVWTCRHRNLVSYIGEEGIFAVRVTSACLI